MKRVILLFICVIFIGSSYAQDTSEVEISGTFTEMLLTDFIKKIENEHSIRIFYPEDLIDFIAFDRQFDQTPLQAALNSILRGYNLGVVLYQNYNYVIVRDNYRSTDFEKKEEAAESRPNVLLNGYVRDGSTGELLIGAAIYVEELKEGTISNESGFFTLNLPQGKYNIKINSVGYLIEDIEVNLQSKQTLSIDLYEKSFQLNEVTISENKPDQNITDVQMGRTTLNIKTLKSIPPFLGEVDLLRSLILLPGVSTVGEGAAGFNVRGGSADQNLILLEGAPIFNPSHLFGFFSAFSSDIIKSATLYKGGIPSQFGGRLSSILDVQLLEGDKNEFHGKGGLGLVSSHLNLEGPIVKDKTSINLAGRISYTDLILKTLRNPNLKNSSASFYDVTGKISHRFNDKNMLSISGYLSFDSFSFTADTLYSWGNRSASMQWSHIFNKKLSGNFSAVYSDYKYEVEGQVPEFAYKLISGIDYHALKFDFLYTPGSKSKVNFGLLGSSYLFKPASLSPNSEQSAVSPFLIDNEKSLENAVYVDHEYTLTPAISILYGARYSLFYNLGPGQEKTFVEGLPKDPGTIIDTTDFSNNEVIQKYHGIEPRLSLKWQVGPTSSVKLGYNRMRQYIHLISNTTAITPLDIWQTSNSNIEPMVGDQFSLGYFRNFRNNLIETSAELYYKETDHLVEYKDGAELLLNRNIETELLEGSGRAYGIELMAKKNTGKLTGWLSYTYSRSERLVDGLFLEEKINNGKYFSSNFDKPHDLTLVGNLEISKRVSFSANFTYSTGRPITYPTTDYVVDGIRVIKYSERNQFRIPDYHRLDLSLTIEGNHKKNNKWHGSYNFSLYNLYGRKNPYSIFFKSRGVEIQAYRLSVLGSIFPSFTYNFKF